MAKTDVFCCFSH